MKEINYQMLYIRFNLINKNQQLKVNIKTCEWEKVKKFFNVTAYPTPNHRLIKGLANLGLDNVKKYYDHIKGDNVEFIIEYGDKSFCHSIESAKNILQEDNKINFTNYQFYVNLSSSHSSHFYLKSQLKEYLDDLFKNQGDNIFCNIVIGQKTKDLINDLEDNIPAYFKKLEPNKTYQTIISITDKNYYSEYVPIKFQIKDGEELVNKIKQINYDQLFPTSEEVWKLSDDVKKHIYKTFKEIKFAHLYVKVLNEQNNNVLEDKEYTLSVEILGLKFQIKWKINIFAEINDITNKIIKNFKVPSNLYALVNSEIDLSIEIEKQFKLFYDNSKFRVYVTSEVLQDKNNNIKYLQYQHRKCYDASDLAEFVCKRKLAPVEYQIHISISSNEMWWLNRKIEKIVTITEKV